MYMYVVSDTCIWCMIHTHLWLAILPAFSCNEGGKCYKSLHPPKITQSLTTHILVRYVYTYT